MRREIHVLFALGLGLTTNAASGGLLTYDPLEKRNLCKAILLSPLQVQLKLEAEARSVKIDLEKLSKEVGGDRIIEDYFNADSGKAKEAIRKGDEAYFTKLFDRMEEAFDSLWLLGSYPSVVPRSALFKHITKAGNASILRLFGMSPELDPRQWLRAVPELPERAVLEARRAELHSRLSLSNGVQKGDYARASAEKLALCALYAPAQAAECAKALSEILDKMNPREYLVGSRAQFEVSRGDLIEEVISDSRYHEAAHALARKLVEYVDAGGVPEEDFVTAVKRSFEGVTGDPVKADDMAWKFIGAYSVLGAEMGNNFRRFAPEASTLNYSCYVMASAIQVLDARMHGTGRLFSVPSGIQTNIDTGKPYHLLMSAFLTRELIKGGYSETAATTATWLAQIGYQMLSKTKGRDPVRAFMLSRVDYANLKIRFDLVNAAAGIRYGVESAKKSPPKMDLSIDQMFKVSFQDSVESPLMSLKEAEEVFESPGISAYTTWTRIFQPKSIFFTAGLTPWYMGMGRAAQKFLRTTGANPGSR